MHIMVMNYLLAGTPMYSLECLSLTGADPAIPRTVATGLSHQKAMGFPHKNTTLWVNYINNP